MLRIELLSFLSAKEMFHLAMMSKEMHGFIDPNYLAKKDSNVDN